MTKFKIGDKVKYVGVRYSDSKSNPRWGGLHGKISGRVFTISDIDFSMSVVWDNGMKNGAYSAYDLELINNNIIMNLKEKFVLALTSEPKKSFRKAGITNGDDMLTEEGTGIFLTWLLHSKYAEEFKKDVVEGLLEEKEKETK